ncbi:MAG: hypothetical protein AAF487_11475 [Bacteroidota bacterium]
MNRLLLIVCCFIFCTLYKAQVSVIPIDLTCSGFIQDPNYAGSQCSFDFNHLGIHFEIDVYMIPPVPIDNEYGAIHLVHTPSIWGDNSFSFQLGTDDCTFFNDEVMDHISEGNFSSTSMEGIIGADFFLVPAWDGTLPLPFVCGANSIPQYIPCQFRVNANWYHSWIKYTIEDDANGQISLHLIALGIENTPDSPIEMGSSISSAVPNQLEINYMSNGIYLNWTTTLNAQACQVKGGPAGGNDPHSFIIHTAPYNELFINESSLNIGEEYQWKVRCASGINPYSGISNWSNYDYFIYQQ